MMCAIKSKSPDHGVVSSTEERGKHQFDHVREVPPDCDEPDDPLVVEHLTWEEQVPSHYE